MGTVFNIFSDFLVKFAIVFVIVILFCLIIIGILHIFKSIALYQMASDENIKYKWLSVCPLINECILTKLAFNHYYLGIIAALSALIGIFFSDSSLPSWLLLLCLMFYIIVNLVSSYKIYKSRTKYYIWLTVISIITFGITVPFMLFVIRKDKMNVNSSPNYTNNKKINVLIIIEVLIFIILIIGILKFFFHFN